MPKDITLTKEALQGKEIKSAVIVNNDEIGYLNPEEGTKYLYDEQYFGTYSIAWIIRIKNDKEISRYNLQFVESIIWANIGE